MSKQARADSSPEEESAKKRKRSSTACVACRRKKIKCDAATPQCHHCKAANTECVYVEIPRKPRVERGSSTTKRLDRMEELLEKLIRAQTGAIGNQGNVSSVGSSPAPSEYNELPLPPKNQHLPSVSPAPRSQPPFLRPIISPAPPVQPVPPSRLAPPNEHSALAVLAAASTEPINAPTGEDDESDLMIASLNTIDTCTSSTHQEPQQYYSHSLCGFLFSAKGLHFLTAKINNEILTNRITQNLTTVYEYHERMQQFVATAAENPGTIHPKMLEVCVDMYSRCQSDTLLALITPEEFSEYVRDPYLHSFEGVRNGRALAVSSLVALIGCWMSRDLTSYDLSPAFIVENTTRAILLAIRTASKSGLTKPSLGGCRSMCAFVTAAHAICLPQIVGYYTAVAVHTARTLGLDRASLYKGLDKVSVQRRLVLWWLIFTFDGETAVHFGRPTTIESWDSDLPLPEVYSVVSDLGALQHRIDMFKLYNRICSRLFSPRNESMTVMENMDDIIKFDSELREWHDSLPEVFKLGEDDEPSQEVLQSPQACCLMMVLHMHCVYNQMIMAVHRQTVLLPPSARQRIINMRTEALKNPSPSQNTSPEGFVQHTPRSFSSGSSPGQDGPAATAAQLSRILRSMNVTSDSARKVVKICTKLIQRKCGLSSGTEFMGLNATIALFLRGIVSPDEHNGPDAALLCTFSSSMVDAVQPTPLVDNTRLSKDLGHVMADTLIATYQEAIRKKREAGNFTPAGTGSPVPSSGQGDTPSSVNGNGMNTPLSTSMSPQSMPETDLKNPGALNMNDLDDLDVTNDLFPEIGVQFANDMLFMTSNMYTYSDNIF